MDSVLPKTILPNACWNFDDQLVRNEQVLRHIENLFEKYIETPISDLNRDQALVPSQATVLHNEYGTAPGMWFEKDRKVFISMPGVPYEMKALMAREIIPRLTETFSRPVILHKTVMTYGLGESAIAEKIEDWENGLPEFIKLAYLPNLGRVRLRLSAKGKDREVLEKAIEQEVQKLHGIIGDIIYGYEEENALEETIGRVLKENRWTLATAESCSGGRLASLFTEHPGASEYFMGSLVCYATRSKVEILGVEQELVDQFSVVSGEVAEAMAQKAREKCMLILLFPLPEMPDLRKGIAMRMWEQFLSESPHLQELILRNSISGIIGKKWWAKPLISRWN